MDHPSQIHQIGVSVSSEIAAADQHSGANRREVEDQSAPADTKFDHPSERPPLPASRYEVKVKIGLTLVITHPDDHGE
jgi:hypothetical protein